jgi:NTP pyrophosphatase (non-canonical NTP hydrolase)
VTNTQKQSDIDTLRALLREFVIERDWDQFHTPKNLATALSVEAAELLEPFQWLVHGNVGELGSEKFTAIRYEMADVFAYLILLADKLDVNLVESLKEKIEINKLKYPAEKVRGSMKKSTDYED